MLNELHLTLENGRILDARPENPLTFSLEGSLIGPGVQGRDLWTVSMFGSGEPDGVGPRFGQMDQILDTRQRNKPYVPNENLDFGNIDLNFDMSSHECARIRYMCVEFSKNDRTSVPFTLTASSGEAWISCVDIPCEGVIASDLIWHYQAPEGITLGAPIPILLDAVVEFSSVSADVIGRNLWALTLYGNTMESGRGDIIGILEGNILGNKAASRNLLVGDDSLNFTNVRSEKDLSRIGCLHEGYLCLTFGRGANPKPPFMLLTTSGGDSIVSCKKVPCPRSEYPNYSKVHVKDKPCLEMK